MRAETFQRRKEEDGFKESVAISQMNKCFVSLLVAQMVKNLPAIQETWVQSLGGEDPLEKGMATIPVLLPGEFPG